MAATPCAPTSPGSAWSRWKSAREADRHGRSGAVRSCRPTSGQGNRMAVRPILKMGDPRLLAPAEPVTGFDTPELHALIADMFDTMAHAGGVGLAAPQIGVGLQLVIMGFERSERYPDAEPVPQTILLNPVITPLSDDMEDGWEGCLSV